MFILFPNKLIIFEYLELTYQGKFASGGINSMTLYEYSGIYSSYIYDIISVVYISITERWLCFIDICGFHFVISTDNWNQTLNWKDKRIKKKLF